ncbi:hypothetical protein JL11_07900 [Brevundimonas sp. DS20]|nr:hypothetical protein JL11_07900 [Brevundimonas sp. DS20]
MLSMHKDRPTPVQSVAQDEGAAGERSGLWYPIKSALARAMQDERDGKPCGCIIEAGCEARGYHDAGYAADGFLDAATDDVVRLVSAHPSPPPASAEARIAELERERDDADRRAGAAERQLEDKTDSIVKRRQWLSRAKAERGYHDNTSFDRVWADTCAAADRAQAAEARADRLAKFGRHINWELSFCYLDDESEPGCWAVHSVNGGRNDREWTLIGRGDTPDDAIQAALQQETQK